MTGETIRSKRVAARIPGHILCRAADLSRTRLSGIEGGYLTVAPEELAKIAAALDRLIDTKHRLAQIAVALGWPTGVDVVPR